MFECKFLNTEMMVHIILNDIKRVRANIPDREGVIIDGLGEFYADVIRKLRNDVKPEECGVRIRRVEPTRIFLVQNSTMSSFTNWMVLV